MKIIPAILTNDLSELTSLINKAEGTVDRVQIDVIDHKFAENITVDPLILKNISTSLNLDFHLMVKGPIDWIDHCVMNKGNRIIGQIEAMENQDEFVQKVINMRSIPGLGVDIETTLDDINPKVLPKISVVLLMSVKAGWAGQEFDLSVWEKIEKLAKIRSDSKLEFKICVDGGVTKELVNQMEKFGVDEVAVGKRIFEPDLKDNMKIFNNS